MLLRGPYNCSNVRLSDLALRQTSVAEEAKQRLKGKGSDTPPVRAAMSTAAAAVAGAAGRPGRNSATEVDEDGLQRSNSSYFTSTTQQARAETSSISGPRVDPGEQEPGTYQGFGRGCFRTLAR